jgi:hypothetical protein
MSLGALVNGTAPDDDAEGRAAAVGRAVRDRGKPAVWVIDPRSTTVSLKPIALSRYTKDRIVVRSGLQAGEIVVSAGVQLLRPARRSRSREHAMSSARFAPACWPCSAPAARSAAPPAAGAAGPVGRGDGAHDRTARALRRPIEPRYKTDLGFRIFGRMVARFVDVGAS